MNITRRRLRSSISIPIILGAITVPLSAALLVGWLLLLGQKISRSEEIAGDVWLLVLGAISFVLIMGVLVIFSISLARGIIEVRKQDSFIDSVTHELKSPLASIQLCLETLTREGIAPEQHEKLRSMMLGDVARLRSFIDDVLVANRLSHAGAGELLNRNEVRVRELVERSAENVSARHKIAASAVEIAIADDTMVITDSASLEIIVKNLIDNAIKYSDVAPRVEVAAKIDEKRRLHLSVIDHGIGMDPRELKRVFHRFYRGSHPLVRQRKGTGLGLFVVYALVRELGGKIHAESLGLGKGTTIRIELPNAGLA